ncbi:MAG: SDR family oxidoreductase [Bdellovibrionota bacterium]
MSTRIADDILKSLDLTGKQFLVLGFTGAIGPEVCVNLGGLGATVHGTTIPPHADQIPSIRKRFEGLPGKFGDSHYLDATDRAALPGAVEAIKGSLGGKPLDGCIVVIGGNTKTIGTTQTYQDYPDASMDLMMELNFAGPERALRAVMPLMKAAAAPKIIWILTVSYHGVGKSCGYRCGKAAARDLVEFLSAELPSEWNPGARVYGVEPGFLDSEQNRANLSPEKSPGKLDAILSHIPTHRLQNADDVGRAIALLCTDAGSIMGNGIIPLNEGFGKMGLGDWINKNRK